jgi:hypothetical protein
MRIVIFILISFLFSCNIDKGKCEENCLSITGLVTDSKGNPLEKAKVKVVYRANTPVFSINTYYGKDRTNNNGYYSKEIEVKEATWWRSEISFTASKKGYRDKTIDVSMFNDYEELIITPDTFLVIDFSLRKE